MTGIKDMFPHSSAELKRVKKVQFGILSPDEIRKMSVCKIEYSEAHEKGKPKSGGVNDIRMGTTDRQLKCPTDSANMVDCPGYFGRVELAQPMFHPGFLKTILKVLRCVSYNTSKLLLNRDDPK